jgi:hypothetical protein
LDLLAIKYEFRVINEDDSHYLNRNMFGGSDSTQPYNFLESFFDKLSNRFSGIIPENTKIKDSNKKSVFDRLFSSFSDNSRNMLFNFFSGNSTHTIDLSISDNLIPLLNNEIDLQNFKSQNIVSNKISYNLNLKFNEWINNESLLGSLSREDKLFQLFNYFLSNGKLYDSFSFLSNSYLFEFLKMLIFELEKIDSKKMLSLLSRDNNDTLATNLVLNLFSKGFSIDERRIYSLFQSVVPKISYFDLLQDDLHEFDIQFIDLSVNNFPLKDLDFKDLFNNTKYHEKVNDQILIDNSISILIYFLINKKRDPKYKNISDNQFLIYLKEIVSFIFSKQLTFLRESFENPVYPLSNKLVVYSLFFQTYNNFFALLFTN